MIISGRFDPGTSELIEMDILHSFYEGSMDETMHIVYTHGELFGSATRSPPVSLSCTVRLLKTLLATSRKTLSALGAHNLRFSLHGGPNGSTGYLTDQ